MQPFAKPLACMLKSRAVRYQTPLTCRGGTPTRRSLPFRLQTRGFTGNRGAPPLSDLSRVEAVLFLARAPLSTRKLAKLAGLADGTKARKMVELLRDRLRARGSALAPVEVAGGVQLLTRPQLADWIERLHGPSEELRLSPPALETLSVAAYRQPVLRAEIEAIRGVQCGEILKLLMERDLLRIVGRSDDLGRPYLYGTTRKFLQVFGLERLEQLPSIDQTLNAENRAAS